MDISGFCHNCNSPFNAHWHHNKFDVLKREKPQCPNCLSRNTNYHTDEFVGESEENTYEDDND